MYYFLDAPILSIGIALILYGDSLSEYKSPDNEDPRVAYLARTGKFSCKEEIQRYLYKADGNVF